jgi:glycerol-3-phosphate acyltransferase PlsY
VNADAEPPHADPQHAEPLQAEARQAASSQAEAPAAEANSLGAATGAEPGGSSRRAGLGAPVVVALSYAVGSIPFSNLAARVLRGVDLRRVGTGTVSGTGLYEVTGFGPLAVVGCLEMAKGASGPLLAGRRRRRLGAVAAGAAIVGHNWSPYLRGAGGRGLSPALGATLVLAPEGTALLGLGLGLGRLRRQTGLGSFLAMVGLVPLLWRTRGTDGAIAAGSVVAPLLAKRLLGNRPPERRDLATYWSRLVFDRDAPSA